MLRLRVYPGPQVNVAQTPRTHRSRRGALLHGQIESSDPFLEAGSSQPHCHARSQGAPQPI